MATIRHLLHINAPIEKVFQAISTIDGLAGWWTTQTSGHSEVNGIIEFRFGPQMGVKMKVTASRPYELVSWQCVDGLDDWIGTTLDFKLDENEGKTRVRFDHAGWLQENDFYAGCSFTWGRFLESLRQFCQAGKGEPFAAG